MASGITYDGVPSAEGGTIFKDVNFWVAQRVPQRTRWVDLIKSNGGSVVPLEKQADMLIADHARKDAPPGSYSWQFIQASAEAGMAQIKDKYLIGPDPDFSRPAASGLLARGRRTAFTAADDAILVKWMLAQAHRRESKLKLFQEFEQINSRHTWQSWQDRWNKKLSLLPSDKLHAMATSAPTDDNPPSRAPAHHPPPPRSAQAPNQKSSLETSLKPAPTPAPKSSPKLPPRSPPKQQKTMSRRKQIPDTIQETPEPETRREESEGLFVSSPSSATGPLTQEEKERLLILDLKIFAGINGLPINLAPTIEGQPVSLYQIVTLLADATEEDKDWEAITRDLGLDASRPDTVRAVERIWSDNLQEFLDQVGSFDEEDEDDGDDGLESELGSEDFADPPITSRKRSLGHQEDDAPSSRPPKRKKLDPYDDIPTTPVPESRSKGKQPAAGSPILGSYTPERQLNGNRNTNTTTRNIPQTPITKAPPLLSHESSYDVTPSQQLDLEARQTQSPVMVTRRAQQDHTSAAGDGSPRAGRPSHPATTPRPVARPTALPVTPNPKPQPQPRPAKRRTLPASFASSRPVEPQLPPPRHSTPRKRPAAMPITGNDRDDTGNSTPRATNTHISEPSTIEGWVEHYQSLGYTHATVVQAMTATTMTPGCLTAHALESLTAGNGIPRNTEGIWTDRDDKSLRHLMSLGERIEDEPTDAGEHQMLQKALRERKRLLYKHGQSRIDDRERFLQVSDQLPSGSGRRGQ